MEYLHSLNIIHRDLKSLNVLLNSGGEVKITDYGSISIFNHIHNIGSTRFNVKSEVMTSNVGTAAWMAPECINQFLFILVNSNAVFNLEKYNEKVDVYSFAITAYEVVSQKLPFDGKPSFVIPALVTKGERPELSKVWIFHVELMTVKRIYQRLFGGLFEKHGIRNRRRDPLFVRLFSSLVRKMSWE